MPKPANIVLTYKDEKGSQGQTIVNMPSQDDLTLTEMIDLAEEHAYLVYQLTSAELIRCSIIIDVPFASDGAETGSDLEEGAEFIFEETGGFTTQIRVPAFRSGQFVSGSPEVDLTNTAVQNFVTHMLDDDLTTSRGENITSLLSARKSFQKSRV